MFKIKKISLMLSASILCIILSVGCSNKVSEKKLNEVKVGFTKEAVIGILGKPLEVGKYEYNGKIEEVWYYSKEPGASTNQQVIFDERQGVVIKVVHLE